MRGDERGAEQQKATYLCNGLLVQVLNCFFQGPHSLQLLYQLPSRSDQFGNAFDLTGFAGGSSTGTSTPGHPTGLGCVNAHAHPKGSNGMSNVIFAEQYPGDEGQGLQQTFLSSSFNTCENGTYWQGLLTTVENKGYGVKGGWKVRLLYFSPALNTPNANGATGPYQDSVQALYQALEALSDVACRSKGIVLV